ncbi:MAG: ribonuclease Y [Candidatus Levybacteria bacterium]|nr:ribonuclease Y [Candidatus Levybacteria bacterium]MBI2420872.1 ribonuclease Y [Candidatus Levybacteria bacterium]
MNQTTDLLDLEKKLLEKQDRIDKERENLEKEKKSFEKKKEEYLEKLQKVSGLNSDDARRELLSEFEKKEVEVLAKRIREREEEIKRVADKKAQEMIVESMRHGAVKYIPEYTVSVVRIPDEEIKGRIIGKEGRNIRAFEQATGVDVDLDEEGIIRLSSFDQVRREVARRSLEKLIKDTRVQPFRIEEIVRETEKELEKIMFAEGEKLSHEVGVFNLPTDVIGILGRAKFRTSYGQNLLLHLLETAKIGTHIAEEVGVNVDVVRIACLLHDIGKVLPGEGSHVKLGVDFLKKYNFPETIINCVAEHHEDKPFSSVESVIVHVADAISGARPGARYEDVEEYGKRLGEMEAIAKKYEGVEDAYAFEAGRELRVIINPGKLDDAQTTLVADKIREEVVSKLAIPGEVKVTAIREFRAVSNQS